MKPVFSITTQAHAACVVKIVEFDIPGGTTTPAEFAEAVEEIESELVGRHPILITGRGPVWGYAMIVHAAHASPAVATNDPRIGYVVVQTHDERFPLGTILTL